MNWPRPIDAVLEMEESASRNEPLLSVRAGAPMTAKMNLIPQAGATTAAAVVED